MRYPINPFTPAVELAAAIRRKEVSPVEVVDRYLDRMDKLDHRLNAFCHRADDDVRKAASVAADELARVDSTEEIPPFHAVHLFLAPGQAELAILFPLGRDRTRAYFATGRQAERARLSGQAQVPAFIQASIETGVPAAWFEHARAIGPLASFEGAASWVEHPERDGVVLVGDAAVDPTWGCGQSLTLRDVRVLRDALCATSDWQTAAHSYADEHDRYFGALHTVEAWMTEIFFTRGPEGDRIRAQALPHFARGAGLDPVGLGPETPVDAAMRRRVFGANAPTAQARPYVPTMRMEAYTP